MMPLGTHSSTELIRLIEAAGESANIDAKGPLKWDGGETSASLAKDIMALANCRDGGVIVIGKREPQPGCFVMDGLSDEQAISFDTTKVAAWVNNHCSPPVHLACYRQEHQSRIFVVIAVSEFQDVPAICTKQFEMSSQGKQQKLLLRKGDVYVRTANAESAHLPSVEEFRQLIGLATAKQGDRMLAMFQAMLKGHPLIAERPDDLFRGEQEEVHSALVRELNGRQSSGSWTFLVHPIRHIVNRWEETDRLRRVLGSSVVRVRREFPQISYDLHLLSPR